MSEITYEKVKPFLPRVIKPARYIGHEINMAYKDLKNVDLRMVISYPDLYEVGMSNLALRILYNCVNSIARFSCERVFSPWLDFEEVLRKNRIPLYSLETFTPLNRFDILGFSVGYELLYTNILTILDLGGIPLLSADRGGKDPLIIAGGPAVYNPEPIADFIDVFILGDGERSLVEFLHMFLSSKHLRRRELLHELNSLDYTYIPSLYRTKTMRGYVISDTDKVVQRRIEPDLDSLPFPVKTIVPLIKIVQDRINVEVNRGCTNGCRFCQAGFTYRPVRERSVSNIISIVRDSLKNTGYDEVSLTSLSIGDYTEFGELVKLIHDEFSQDNVSISLPSLRVNSTNMDILELIGSVRKSGLTFAVESADENVRRKLNKLVDESQLKEIINRIVLIGWRLVKLYFMIGLPMAHDEGEKIVSFIKRLMGFFPKLSINANISVFVPKPHTPFERERQMNLEESERIIYGMREMFRNSRVRIKFQNPRMSFIEGILARGDRRVGSLLLDVYGNGERFSSWDEVFNFHIWEKSLRNAGLSGDHYMFDTSVEQLPWYFINCGITQEFLMGERERAHELTVTENCMVGACSHCGVCNEIVKNRTARDLTTSSPELSHLNDHMNDSFTGKTIGNSINPSGSPDTSMKMAVDKTVQKPWKMLFSFRKKGMYRFISHRDLMNLLVKIGRSAGVPFRYSEGYNPKPRLIIPFPLPLGIESDYELGEVILIQYLDAEDFIMMYNKNLPFDLRITSAGPSNTKQSIASKHFFHDYHVYFQGCSPGSIIDLLTDIGEGEMTDDVPGAFFCRDKDHIFIRLEGNRSIKGIFKGEDDSYLDYNVRRVKIWHMKDDVLVPFL